jgi:hypothetical protein
MPVKILDNITVIESKHSPQLAAGTIKWGIQRGRASPLVACGVKTPYAKCLVYCATFVTGPNATALQNEMITRVDA